MESEFEAHSCSMVGSFGGTKVLQPGADKRVVGGMTHAQMPCRSRGTGCTKLHALAILIS